METPFRLSVQYATDNNNLPTRPQFRKWVRAALSQEAVIVLRIVDESEGYELNSSYRGKQYATNVLTFVYDDTQPLSGDVVLCATVVEKEAQQQHKDLTAHYAHLTVHGVLHVQGYDHIDEAEAAVMEKLEAEILVQLGYDDPYKEITKQ
ncbi:MAG: rRNA maturation RNase YbeY [Betaproteobacteria bacterium]|nr:rRNA maturation RNase YbeY [Betaproteobacteria bacterium]